MGSLNFYPRSPRGERPRLLLCLRACVHISIHAPREGSDDGRRVGCRGYHDISIHAPREGSDQRSAASSPAPMYFYPRSPRGERRLDGPQSTQKVVEFLSTLPARGATLPFSLGARTSKAISIHAPREGSDLTAEGVALMRRTFLSTLPARGATDGGYRRARTGGFLSTLPARGATIYAPGFHEDFELAL